MCMKNYFTDNLIVPETVLSIYTTKQQAIQINKIIKMYGTIDLVSYINSFIRKK